MNKVFCGLLALPFSGFAQTHPGNQPLLPLDTSYAVHGIPLDTPEGSLPALRLQFSGVGKRWKTSRVYSLLPPADTLTVAGQPVQPAFWFRGGKFIGVTYQLRKERKTHFILQQLTRRYGPPKPGGVAGSWYWLGRRTYILYEEGIPDVVLHVASLAMLNEQVTETTVRAEARQVLGWQPDSLGMPPQQPVPRPGTPRDGVRP